MAKRVVKAAGHVEGLLRGGSLHFSGLSTAHLVKQAIQAIAGEVEAGRMEPCPECKAGFVRRMDPAGSMDWCECQRCRGWTVVKRQVPA